MRYNLMNFIYKLGLCQRVIIEGTILLLIGYFIYTLIIPPQLLNLKAVKKQLLTQNRFLQSKKQKIKNLLVLKEEFSQLQAKAEESNRHFFTDDEAITFLKGLDNLAENETSNNLIQIKPSSEETISESILEKTRIHYKRLDVQVVVSGQFSTIYDLIHRFNTSKRLLSLKELDIEIEKEEPLELRASFILSIYILSKTEGA